MNYPCVVVERPHQSSPSAWTAYSKEDVLNRAYEMRFSAFDVQRFATKGEAIAEFQGWYEGEDDVQIPDDLAALPDGPVVFLRTGTEGSPHEEWLLAEGFDEEQAAVGQIGDDLSGIDTIESAEEFAAWWKNSAHNKPFDQAWAEARCLGWVKDEEDEEDEE